MESDMEPQTIRLDEEEWDQLEREADDQGFANRTEYVRWILRNRSAIKNPSADAVSERLTELEERMDQLEAKLDDKTNNETTG